MLILNEKSAAIAKLAEWYFKTSYVDIKHLVISGLQFQFINFKTSYVDIKLHSTRYLNYPILHFKTSYVDIKRNSRIKGLHLDVISKHHMLILNVI